MVQYKNNETMKRRFLVTVLPYLKSIFGDDIIEEEYSYGKGVPLYISGAYKTVMIVWGENRCVLLTPVDLSWRLPAVKTHMKIFQEICPYPCALSLDNITAKQRNNLVGSHIPFISASNQVYLPFWGCVFSERYRASVRQEEKMAPGTQLVFLFLYYREDDEPVNLTGIAEKLSLSKATCTRAFSDLVASGLVRVKEKGTNKWIAPAYEKAEFLRKGYDRMKSPVERTVYLKTPFNAEKRILSGIRALSERSMLGTNESDGAIAVSRKDVQEIRADSICSERYFGDFGGTVVEVWSYDPAVFALGSAVDDISLLLSLEKNQDERVQMSLDEIRRRHGLPVNDE